MLEHYVETSDDKTVKAITSNTRIQILKNLRKRRMTATELAKKTIIQKNAIYKHLDILISVGIVQRIDSNERKWVYYELTHKGLQIVSSGKLIVLIFQSFGIGTLLLGISMIISYLLREIPSPKTRGLAISQFDFGVILIFISIILLLIAWFTSKNRWKKIAENIGNVLE